MDPNLNEISTVWPELREAQEGSGPTAQLARTRVLMRYERAIRRYLLGALRDPDAADEVYQEFVCKFLNGAFCNADPARGRFRNLLTSSLANLVSDHRRKARQTPSPLDSDGPTAADEAAVSDGQFMRIWREELIERVWEDLALEQSRTGRPLCVLLKLKAKEPGLRSAELADQLEQRIGQKVTVNWVRKRLCEARARFKSLLLDEVGRTLADPGFESLEDELRWLEILDSCRSALYERFQKVDPRQAHY
jgi:RNA polymerase sigma-70 factor (ECF subfamily)